MLLLLRNAGIALRKLALARTSQNCPVEYTVDCLLVIVCTFNPNHMTTKKLREEFEIIFGSAGLDVEYDETAAELLERVTAVAESKLTEAKREAYEEVIEEVKFQSSIIFPDTEEAMATAGHLVYNLRTKFLNPNKS